MLDSGKVTVGLLTLLLAGCATRSTRESAQSLKWERVEVAPAPVLAPPPPPPVATPITPVVTAPTNHFTGTWIPLYQWCQANNSGVLSRLTNGPQATFALQSSTGRLVVRTGSHLAYWDGLELRLGFAPQMTDGQPYIHTLDLDKTVQPLLRASAACLKSEPVIVLDPGHGGEDVGARSILGNRYEKEFTLDWARRIAALLATNGWHVFLTRNNDSNLALSNRVAVADQRKADLFLSLHFNSAGADGTQAGLETYCLTPSGLPSTVTRGFDDDRALSFPNNAYDTQNLEVALRLHRALLQVNGHHDRGVRRARFLGVLRTQLRPAVLVEGGYLSSPTEARLIADPAYREKLAEAVAKALLEESGTRFAEVKKSEPEFSDLRAEMGKRDAAVKPPTPEVKGSRRAPNASRNTLLP